MPAPASPALPASLGSPDDEVELEEELEDADEDEDEEEEELLDDEDKELLDDEDELDEEEVEDVLDDDELDEADIVDVQEPVPPDCPGAHAGTDGSPPCGQQTPSSMQLPVDTPVGVGRHTKPFAQS